MTVLCKDCKYYVQKESAGADRCAKRTISSAVMLVRGFDDAPLGFCEETRFHEGWCGKDGNWFEPKADA